MAALTDVNGVGSAAAKKGKLVDIVAALIAVAVTWGIVNPPEPFFKVPPEYHLPQLGPPPEKYRAYLEQQHRVDFQNAGAVIGILCGILGGGLAISRVSRLALPIRVIVGCLGSLILGAVAGVIGCYLQMSLSRENQLTVVHSVLINATLFGVAGAGIGAVMGCLQGNLQRIGLTLVTGLVAGAFGGMLYPVIISQLMASVNIEAFIPIDSTARIIWLGMGSLMIAILLPIDLDRMSKKSPAGEGSGV